MRYSEHSVGVGKVKVGEGQAGWGKAGVRPQPPPVQTNGGKNNTQENGKC